MYFYACSEDVSLHGSRALVVVLLLKLHVRILGQVLFFAIEHHFQSLLGVSAY
jgi:hypothetical protein